MNSGDAPTYMDGRVRAWVLTFSIFTALLPTIAILFGVDAEYKRLASDHDAVVARMAADRVGASIRAMEWQLESMAKFVSADPSDVSTIRSVLTAARNSNPKLLQVALVGTRRTIRASGPNDQSLDLRPAPDGKAAFHRFRGIPYALLSSWVPGEQDEAVVAAFSLEPLPARLHALIEARGGRAFLLSANGSVLISDNGQPPAGLVDRDRGGWTEQAGHRWVDDGRYSTEVPIEGTSWVLLVTTPGTGLLSRGYSLSLLVGATLLAVVVAFVMASFLRRIWIDPLQRHVRRLTASSEALENTVQQQEVLVRETHHRVKNDLQMLSSMLNLSYRDEKEGLIRETLAKSQNRLHAISLIHELLCESRNLSGVSLRRYIEELIRRIKSSLVYDSEAIAIISRVGDYYFDAETSVTCGLLLNELLTNSIKYAFAPGGSGVILVQLQRVGAERYLLSVQDDGVGLPPGRPLASRQSLGMRLVHALTDQLGGTLSVVSDSGTFWRIYFGAKEVGARAEASAVPSTVGAPDRSSGQT